ncbi:NAD(P)-binding protein [Cadophora sp. DSE1049]|nr:NAD(P)-binding protein [Cadophora sp. DSE1049]
MPSIKGQYILIIGGTSGMGYAAATLALQEHANVAIASSNPTRVETAVKALKGSFPESNIEGYVVDLEGEDLEKTLDHFLMNVTCDGVALLDHIISTAGRAPIAKPLSETSVEEITEVAKRGITVPMVLAKVGLRYLKRNYTSSLTFTGGHISEKPVANYSLYSALAAGLVGLTRNLAMDMAPIRVNLVSPGATLTEMWGPNREQIGEVVGKNALLGKVGSAEEVGEAYIYLMKDSNATGSCVSTNGGSLLK